MYTLVRLRLYNVMSCVWMSHFTASQLKQLSLCSEGVITITELEDFLVSEQKSEIPASTVMNRYGSEGVITKHQVTI